MTMIRNLIGKKAFNVVCESDSSSQTGHFDHETLSLVLRVTENDSDCVESIQAQLLEVFSSEK